MKVYYVIINSIDKLDPILNEQGRIKWRHTIIKQKMSLYGKYYLYDCNMNILENEDQFIFISLLIVIDNSIHN